jgi:hypothetical protein
MAFQTAAGYGNLPNGNFSAVIYSKKVQLAFRKKTVVGDITNSDYFGEISNFGDTVEIIKEPEINVKPYARGATVDPQDLDDENFVLVIDKANYFAFAVDDIETKQSHVNWEQLASSRAAYRLADNYDQEVLAYMAGYRQVNPHEAGSTVNTIVNGTKAIPTAGNDELLTSMKLIKGSFSSITTAGAGDHSVPVAPRMPGITTRPTDFVSPVDIVNRMNRLLDEQFVPADGRWIVIDPIFKEMLHDEDSRFLNADFGPNGALRSGASPLMIAGMKVYMSNNLPRVGTGPGTAGTANQNTNFGVLLAGHNVAVATAEQINKTETFRSSTTFGDVVRGMHLYGRKILRPECLVTVKYNVA